MALTVISVTRTGATNTDNDTARLTKKAPTEVDNIKNNNIIYVSLHKCQKFENSYVECEQSALLELCQSNVVAVTETWLNSNITDGELFSDDYVTYRKDREATVQNKRGGGILLSIIGNIPSQRRPDLEAEYVG